MAGLSRSQPHFRKDGCRPRKMSLAHFAAFLDLADSALPGFWLANQIALCRDGTGCFVDSREQGLATPDFTPC